VQMVMTTKKITFMRRTTRKVTTREETCNINLWRDRGEDARDLGRKIVDLKRKCANMAREMEKKDKGKTIVVDRLFLGTSSPFT
jgi:hypothetical protein